MELTGQCKKDFEKWLKNQYVQYGIGIDILNPVRFITVPFAMQYGVFVDFFHTIEYEDRTLGIFIMNKTQILVNVWNQSLDEARTEAIKQANKIHNKK